MKQITHGTLCGYAHHHCRCILCKAVQSSYMKTYWDIHKTELSASNKRYYNSHKEEILAQGKVWRNTAVGKESQKRYGIKRYSTPEGELKRKARWVINYAVKTRRVIKQPCVCGATNTVAHHEDYTKPLAVEWFCNTHHQQLHNWRD